MGEKRNYEPDTMAITELENLTGTTFLYQPSEKCLTNPRMTVYWYGFLQWMRQKGLFGRDGPVNHMSSAPALPQAAAV